MTQLPADYVLVPASGLINQPVMEPVAPQKGKLQASDQLIALVFLLVLAGLLLTKEFDLMSVIGRLNVEQSNAPVYVSPSHYGRESNCQPPLICPDPNDVVAPVTAPVAPVAPVTAPVAPVVPVAPVTAPEAPVAPVAAPEAPVAAPEAPYAPTAVPEAPVAPVVAPQPEAPVAPVVPEVPAAPAAPANNTTNPACHPPMTCDPTAPAAPAAPVAPAAPTPVPEKPSVLLPSEVNGYVSPSDFGTQPACHPPMVCDSGN